MLVDFRGDEVVPSDSDPVMERGAAWVAELLTAGPEAAGLAFAGMTREQRDQVLADVFVFMQFIREVWNGLDGWNQRATSEQTEGKE